MNRFTMSLLLLPGLLVASPKNSPRVPKLKLERGFATLACVENHSPHQVSYCSPRSPSPIVLRPHDGLCEVPIPIHDRILGRVGSRIPLMDESGQAVGVLIYYRKERIIEKDGWQVREVRSQFKLLDKDSKPIKEVECRVDLRAGEIDTYRLALKLDGQDLRHSEMRVSGEVICV